MLFILGLLILLIIFNVLIIGLLLSRISINVEDLSVYSNFKIDRILVSIDIYVFKKIKLLSIVFYDEYFKIAFIKIYYEKILKYKIQIEDNIINVIRVFIGRSRLIMNLLNPNIELFYMNLVLSTKNAAVTSLTSSVIGSTTSMILSKYVKEYDERKIYFKIVPVFYNVNGFNFKLKTKINIDTFYVLVFIYEYLLLKNKI